MVPRSAIFGYLFALSAGLVAGLFIGIPLLSSKNSAGLFVVAIGPIISVALYGLWRQSSASEEPKQSREHRLALAGVAFLAAPVLSFLIGLFCIAVFEIHPMDRASTVGALTTVGFIAGIIVAAALAVSSGFK